ncbi:MAG: hypothetical protein KC506_03255 [Nanoarchaeota archaeon]|nr:hypothetical protein [Nanoarchaeota archaeon]
MILKQKKAAIELSIGTIVIIVIAMSMLILGIVLVRQVMCAGIVLTSTITDETESQITDLFGSDERGIKCSGEDGGEITFGSGDSRELGCISNLQARSENHEMRLESAILQRGRIGSWSEGDELKGTRFFIKEGWKGVRPAGRDSFAIANLDLNYDVDVSVVTLEYTELQNGQAVDTHDITIDIEPVSGFKAAIC